MANKLGLKGRSRHGFVDSVSQSIFQTRESNFVQRNFETFKQFGARARFSLPLQANKFKGGVEVSVGMIVNLIFVCAFVVVWRVARVVGRKLRLDWLVVVCYLRDCANTKSSRQAAGDLVRQLFVRGN